MSVDDDPPDEEMVEVSRAKAEDSPGEVDRFHPDSNCRYAIDTIRMAKSKAKEKFHGIRECSACGEGPSLHAKATGTEVC